MNGLKPYLSLTFEPVYGMVVATTDHAGIPDQVTDGLNGISCLC